LFLIWVDEINVNFFILVRVNNIYNKDVVFIKTLHGYGKYFKIIVIRRIYYGKSYAIFNFFIVAIIRQLIKYFSTFNG